MVQLIDNYSTNVTVAIGPAKLKIKFQKAPEIFPPRLQPELHIYYHFSDA